MSRGSVAGDWKVGVEISGPVRRVTAERIEWYGSGMLAAATNALTQAGSNIHNDEAIAKSEGLPGAIADGMISTNWVSSMLVEHFGLDYVERGELRTRYIKPIPLGATVSVRGRLRAVGRSDRGSTRYELDVWCEDEHGTHLTVGEASVESAPGVTD
jgi:acyl dehydratase